MPLTPDTEAVFKRPPSMTTKTDAEVKRVLAQARLKSLLEFLGNDDSWDDLIDDTIALVTDPDDVEGYDLEMSMVDTECTIHALLQAAQLYLSGPTDG